MLFDSLNPDCDFTTRQRSHEHLIWSDCLTVRSWILRAEKLQPVLIVRKDRIAFEVAFVRGPSQSACYCIFSQENANFGGSSSWIRTRRLSHLSSLFSMLLTSGVLLVFFFFVLCFYFSSALSPVSHPTTILFPFFFPTQLSPACHCTRTRHPQ